MSHARARRRASRFTRPAAALGVISLSALGLTAVPASAEIAAPTENATAAPFSGDEPAAPGVEPSAGPTVPASEAEVPPAGDQDDAPPSEDAPAETPAGEDAPVEAPVPATEAPSADQAEAADTEAEAPTDPVAPASVGADGTVTIDLLGVTDFHGALDQAPILAGMINEVRAANPDTVLVSAGDNIGGSTYASAIQQDQPTIDVLNAMDLEVSAVGNHEFDQGYADLRDRVLPAAGWDYLGANVDGAAELAPYEIVTVAGVDVAFVGSVTEETPRIVSADGITGLVFTDPVARTNQIAAELSDGDPANDEADVVVALVHEGANLVAGALNEHVDAAFTGHSHATTTVTTVNGAPVVQAGSSGSHLAHITLAVSPEGEVTATGGNVEVTGEGVTPDATVQGIVDNAKAQAEILGQEPVGSVTAPFNRGTDTGVSDGSNRGVESPLGNLLGEVAKWTAESVGLAPDLGIINPGGIRADLDPDGDGVVTYAEAFAVQPFGNTIGTIELTGEQVVTMLEQQFQPGSSRPVLRLGLSSDVDYVYDPSAPQGEHITDVTIGGVPLEPWGTYTVASNTFLLGGQDGFDVFTEGTNLTETGIVDLQGLVDLLQARPDLTPDYTQRSVGLTLLTHADGWFESGDEVVLELSSLSFTTDEPKPESVTLLVDGEETAQFAVDSSITPGTDETGTATVSFTVPDLEAYVERGVISFELVFGATPESVQSVGLELWLTEDGAFLPPPDMCHCYPDGDTSDNGAPVVTPASRSTRGTLPDTGADASAAIVAAAALILLGGTTLALVRRRSTTTG